MKGVFKPFEGAKSNVSYTKTSNPAMLQHMNVSKARTTALTKRILDELVGSNPGPIVKSKFQWHTYPDKLVLTIHCDDPTVYERPRSCRRRSTRTTPLQVPE
jgi:hypothetical protein